MFITSSTTLLVSNVLALTAASVQPITSVVSVFTVMLIVHLISLLLWS